MTDPYKKTWESIGKTLFMQSKMIIWIAERTLSAKEFQEFADEFEKKPEEDVIALVKKQETVVRCKDCTYRGEINCPQYYRRTELSDDYFCADGEKR